MWNDVPGTTYDVIWMRLDICVWDEIKWIKVKGFTVYCCSNQRYIVKLAGKDLHSGASYFVLEYL